MNDNEQEWPWIERSTCVSITAAAGYEDARFLITPGDGGECELMQAQVSQISIGGITKSAAMYVDSGVGGVTLQSLYGLNAAQFSLPNDTPIAWPYTGTGSDTSSRAPRCRIRGIERLVMWVASMSAGDVVTFKTRSRQRGTRATTSVSAGTSTTFVDDIYETPGGAEQ